MSPCLDVSVCASQFFKRLENGRIFALVEVSRRSNTATEIMLEISSLMPDSSLSREFRSIQS